MTGKKKKYTRCFRLGGAGLVFAAIIAIAVVYRLKTIPDFGQQQDCGLVEFAGISEASGLVASRSNRDVLWTHNDSGHGPVLYALNKHGRHLGRYRLMGASSHDWEDIAVGPGPIAGMDYIFIGDIGDNSRRREFVRVYRIPEPEVSSTQPPVRMKLAGAEEIRLTLPNKPRDSETLMVDPLNGDIYLVTKRERKVAVYRAAYPQVTGKQLNELETIARLNLTEVVAGDISPSGLEVLLKTYSAVYYWQRDAGESLEEMFKERPESLPYILEPQGEAICWSSDGKGYFTVSEELARVPAHLYFYPKLSAPYANTESTQQPQGMEQLQYRLTVVLNKALRFSYRLSTKLL